MQMLCSERFRNKSPLLLTRFQWVIVIVTPAYARGGPYSTTTTKRSSREATIG